MRKTFAGALLIAAMAVGAPSTASADPVGSGTASAFGATATITDQELIPPTPVAEQTAPPFGDDVDETTIAIPAEPLAVNGTLIARAAVHAASDLETEIEQEPAQHELAGPYNARAVGQVEDLEVLVDAVEAEVPLLEADLIRGEAVAVCRAGTVSYAATSEVFNLVIGGEDPLSGPLNDLLGQISAGLNDSPLVDVVDVDVNVVEETASGVSVDALRVTLLTPASDPQGLVQLRLGHAEVDGVGCGAPKQCADTQDNDGDGVIDAEDPGCHSDGDADNPDSYDPTDDSEGGPQCSDSTDNDGDGVIDADDPGCHSDGDAGNPGSYDPNDDSEADEPTVSNTGGAPLPSDGGSSLPKTGGTAAAGTAAVLGAGALGLLALRRRLTLG
jgi:hypothetical protein